MPITNLLLVCCLVPLFANAGTSPLPIDLARAASKTPSSVSELLHRLHALAAQGLLWDEAFFSTENTEHFVGGTLGEWKKMEFGSDITGKFAPLFGFSNIANDLNLPCEVHAGRATVVLYGATRRLNSLSVSFKDGCKIELKDIEQWFGKAWKPVRLPALHPSPGRLSEDGGIEFQVAPSASMRFRFGLTGLLSVVYDDARQLPPPP